MVAPPLDGEKVCAWGEVPDQSTIDAGIMARNTNVHSSKQQHQRRNSTRLEKAAQEGRGNKNMPTGRILLGSDYAPTELLPPVAASVFH